MKYERIRNFREDTNQNQQKVADYLHISQRTYSYYESGEHSIPVEVLRQLADLYNTSVDYLIGRTDDPAPPR